MNKKHTPLDAMEYPRFEGLRTFMRLPHTTNLDNVDFLVAGIPFDTGATFRVGARFGPSGIRENSLLLRPYNPAQDIEVFKYCSGIDYGDIPIVPGYLPESHKLIEQETASLIQPNIVPIFMGGDHSISLPVLRSVKKKYGPVGLIHFDAHSDLWHGYYDNKDTHGTPFRRAIEENLIDPSISCQIGLRGPLYNKNDFSMSKDAGLLSITGPELHSMGIQKALSLVKNRIGNKKAYLTFDIDFIDPAFAPGTGTPEAGGFTGYDAISFVRGLKEINFIGFDMVEVMPPYDPAHVTSLLAANIIYEFISLIAIQKKINT
ncbi:MAG: agmatinase [Candidatus Neomarinimicrobiota bacterium]